MIRKNKAKIAALTLALAIGVSANTLAAPNVNPNSSTDSEKKIEHKKHEHGKNHGMARLGEYLGLSKEEIREARKSGKTIFDLAKEKKNMSPEQVKSLIIKNKTEEINKAVSDGKLTREKADSIIAKMTERINNWDGSFKKKEKQEK